MEVMHLVWEFTVPLLISLACAFAVSRLLELKLDFSFAITYMGFCMWIYLYALFDIKITIGYFLYGVIILLLWIVSLRKKAIYSLKDNELEIIITFVLIYTAIFLFDLQRGFTHWDEMSHWGPMAKEIIRLDQLYSVTASKLQVHKDYPPVIAIFEAAWAELCGGYAEKYLYRSLHVLIWTMILPFITSVKSIFINKRMRLYSSAMLAIIILAICTVLSLNDGNILTTIYTDGVLGVTFAFCALLVYIKHEYSKKEIVTQAVALSFLMLVKQIGFEYFCLCYLLLILLAIVDYKKGVCARNILWKAFFLFVIPVSTYLSWNMYYVKINQLTRQFSAGKFDLQTLWNVICGVDKSSWRYEGTVNYFKSLYEKPLFMLGTHTISYVDMMIVSLIVYGTMFFLQKKIKTNLHVLPMFVVFLCGVCGHVMMQWITYMFGYNDLDFLELACYERYMNVIWIGMCMLILFQFTQAIGALMTHNSGWFTLTITILTVIMVLSTKWSDTVQFLKPALSNNSNLIEYYTEAEFIMEETNEDDAIYIITQSHTGYFEYVFAYLTMPRTYNKRNYSLGEAYSEGDNWTQNITQEEFLDFAKDYDYMYLWDVDEQFRERYASAICNASDITFANGYLYSICPKDDGDIELILQGTFEK